MGGAVLLGVLLFVAWAMLARARRRRSAARHVAGYEYDAALPSRLRDPETGEYL